MSHTVPPMAYTKLFSSIVTSTIWMEDDKTRIVWITMLAIADKNGEVQGSIPGLARISGVPVEDCRAAIAKFLAPDPDSRTKDDEGRRIEEIDGGWALLNHNKYRDMASKDEQRQAEAMRKARYREKQKRNGLSQSVPDKSRDVPKNQHIAEADTEAEGDTKKEIPPIPQGGTSRPKRKRLNPKHERVAVNTPAMIQINDWFGRKADTLWTIEQARILELINPSEAVLNGMGNFYLADETPETPLYRRTTLTTLLNNWDDELDKARAYSRKQNQ